MSVFKCGIKFKRVLGDSKQSAKNKLVAHGFIDKAYNIPNFYEFQKAHKEMNDFASKLLERRVQLYNLNERGTIAYPVEDVFREIDAKRREIAASKSLTPTFQDKKDAFRKEKLANEQITSVRDVIATQDTAQERFEDLSEIESTEEIQERKVLTPSQKQNIANLKELDSRWEQYSDEDIQRFIESVFPESQVKDIVYHGTNTTIESFDKNKIATNTLNYGFYGKGFYFNETKNDLINWWKTLYKKEPNIVTVIIDTKNPYREISNVIEEKTKLGNKKETEEFTNALLQNNYDSVLPQIPKEEGSSEYVVFEPEQIYILNSDKAISDMEEFIRPKDIIDEEIQQKSKEIQELATKQVKAITEQEPKEGINISDVMNNESSEEVKLDEKTGQYLLFSPLNIKQYEKELSTQLSRASQGIPEQDSGQSQLSDSTENNFISFELLYADSTRTIRGIQPTASKERLEQSVLRGYQIATELSKLFYNRQFFPIFSLRDRLVKETGLKFEKLDSYIYPALFYSSSKNTIYINPIAIGNDLSLQTDAFTAYQFYKNAILEELIHVATYHLTTEQDRQDIFNELTTEEINKIKQYYSPDTDISLTDNQVAVEYVRQILQQELFGNTTEKYRNIFSKYPSDKRNVLDNILNWLLEAFNLKAKSSKTQDKINTIKNYIQESLGENNKSENTTSFDRIQSLWKTNQTKLLSKYPDITYEDFVSLTEQERENLLACF